MNDPTRERLQELIEAAERGEIAAIDMLVQRTPEQDELVQRQIDRWNAPETHVGAKERADRAGQALKRSQWRSLLQDRQMQRVQGFKNKLYWLRQLAQTFAEAVEPESACRAGCSACCYQPVMLTEAEAEVIGREIQVQPRKPEAWRTEPAPVSGQACPFLQDGRCSIYEHRPMACRLLFNMDVDDLLCRIVPGSPAKVPYANHMDYHIRYVLAHFPGKVAKVNTPEELEAVTQAIHLGDIRDFFPDGLQMRLPGCC